MSPSAPRDTRRRPAAPPKPKPALAGTAPKAARERTAATGKAPLAKGPRKRQEIIDAAARCFARQGYDGTSMRDVAKLANLLPGSIYYHFASKEEMLKAVHDELMRSMTERVLLAIDPKAGPWERLEQASAAYLENLVTDEDYAGVVIAEFPRRQTRKLRDQLVIQRDRFEQIFVELVDDLPLAAATDRKYWRLALMSIIAWSFIWYRPGKDTPAEIAGTMIALLRQRTEAEAVIEEEAGPPRPAAARRRARAP